MPNFVVVVGARWTRAIDYFLGITKRLPIPIVVPRKLLARWIELTLVLYFLESPYSVSPRFTVCVIGGLLFGLTATIEVFLGELIFWGGVGGLAAGAVY